MELLKVENLISGYGKIDILKSVSIDVNEGEIVCVLGANGAGKTTLINTISGLIPVKSGKIKFLGKDITNTPPHKRVEIGLVQVPEGRKIFPKLTVLENLEIGAFLINDTELKKKTLEWIYSLFPVLYERRDQKAGTLSGGEQQMLAIGRALMSNPKLLMLDEPSMGLAVKLMATIFDVIKEISKKIAILLVEQNANKALSIVDRGYLIETGKIVLSAPRDILTSSEEVKKVYLGG
jgi:branched-chain amino acid transport system ATP-binding protein